MQQCLLEKNVYLKNIENKNRKIYEIGLFKLSFSVFWLKKWMAQFWKV